ncbi:MAG: SusC/RagA family TonB-linked outer membrane protein [Ferruginibacter sp.]
MRKLLTMMAIAMLSLGVVTAQTRLISGKVTDSKGVPVPGATVKLKSGAAVAADDRGNFQINAQTGDVLTITSIDFETLTAKVGSESTIAVSMVSSENKLSEVVVTALGIKRNKNTLPYAAQQIGGDDVSRVRGGNIMSAMSGKVAGLQIQQGNGIGGSTNVVIRGNKSLTGNNQALFVVDGVPVDNSNNNSSAQRQGQTGYDYGNAAADINPDDIESYNVLKGAAASALYGSRAANGVIMITTKKAKRGLGITVNTGITVGNIDKKTMPKYQTKYGVGYSSNYQKDGFLYFDVDGDGVKDLVVPTSEDASYGAAFDPSLMVFQWDAFDPASPYYKKAKPWIAAANNPTTFYETAVSNNNSIFLNGANDKGTYTLGYTRNEEVGTLPNSKVIKNILNFGSTYKIMDNLEASAGINYSQIKGKGRYGTGYSGQNVNQNFRQWYQTSTDIQDQKAAYFRNEKNITWNWKDPSVASGLVPIYTDNYYWTRYQNVEKDSRSRVFGNVALNYKATNWLSILGRISVDNYTELQEERVAVGSQGVAKYSRFDRTFNEINYDLIATFNKDITSDLNLKALAGTNIRKTTISSSSATTNGGLVVANLYSLANSKGTIAAPVEAYQPKEVDGYFGGLTLGWRNFLTVDGTIRRDISSTLPIGDNGYNYYAVSGAWLFSHHLQNASWLSSGKLRANYATVGNDAPWGSIKDVYDNVAPFGSTLLYSLPGTQNNKLLKPENTISKEIGLEMSFLKNRLGFDVSYYITNTKDQIIPVSVSTSTGYTSKYVNAGDVQNKGFEISLNGNPVKTQSFSWDVTVNWSASRSKVLSLYNDSKNLLMASFQGGISANATVGEAYGVLKGRGVQTLNGQKLVGADGYYVNTATTTDVIANINPDWYGGIYNSFKYKDFTLGFLVDMRHGGSLFSLDMYYAQYTGVLEESAGLNDQGKPIRSALSDGGGYVFPGVTADGKPNTKHVVVDANSPTIPGSEYVYDASYIKLREATLSYNLPQSIFKGVKAIKGIEFSVIGRNLWIIHKNLPYSDPEENLSSGNVQGYQSGAYPTTRSIGFNLKFKF